MDVILKQDISGLGYKNAGYGNNYLIPNGFALIANDSNRRLITENVRQMAHKAAKLKQDAEALAAKVGDFAVEIKTKAGESGKIFGAVTALQIADVLKAKGFDIDRKKVILKENPKQVGNYTAILDLHKEVKHEIKVVVSAE
jgi:large subunit ribosomal protein L9